MQTVEEISKAQEEAARRQSQESMQAKGQSLKLPPPQPSKWIKLSISARILQTSQEREAMQQEQKTHQAWAEEKEDA